MIQLSSSALGILKECPRCFWLDRNKKVKRPQGIKSGMPVAVDNILKAALDKYRGTQLPPALAREERLKGFQLYNGQDLPKMRHWASNPYKMTNSKGDKIVGAFDDLLVNPSTEIYAYLDYKTTGKEPTQEFGEMYYQKQCDIYTQMLILGGKKVADFGVLLFFWPVPSKTGGVDFGERAIFLKPNPDAAEALFKKAMECLEGPLPGPANDCEYCEHHRMLGLFDEKGSAAK